MQRQQKIVRTLRRRLLARGSSLAVRVALRPRGWAPGLLAMGLISAQAPALAQEVIDLATDADVTIQGAAAGDLSGVSVSGAGDVDGDGVEDLIVDAYQASPNGRTQAGASYVVFGTDQGFPATIDLASEADVTIQGASAYDASGISVSGAGDINGDGFDDLLIGASDADPNDRIGAGASYVVLGAADLAGTIDLADPINGADLVIQGASAYDFSGFSVSGAGDIDGDGIDDLIIGAPNAAPNGRTQAGASYVLFGTDQSFPAMIDLASDADLTIQGAAVDDGFGYSVSDAGDVDGDGIDDLIIGARTASPNGRSSAGASYVVFGSDQGLPATIDLASDADVIVQGAAEGDLSGTSVSGAGDVSGDGIDDLIIGAPGVAALAGASYVVFGSDQGFPEAIDLASEADLIIQGAAESDESGRSVSGAGDIDGDGIDDLIIGAPFVADLAGASYVVFGRHKGFPAIIDLASGADLIIQGAVAGDFSGRSVSGAGDVDGDGIDDLIIGATGADPNGRDYAGASYVVFGSGPVAALEDLIADVEVADLQPRIEKILTRTLSRALDNLNKGRERRAIIALRLFIIEVKVFRGKKIDEADADAWIADAEAIIDTLKDQKDRHRAPPPHAPSPMVEAQD